MSRTTPDPLLVRVREDPGALALVTGTGRWTRAHLLAAADDTALALAEAGVGEASLVACLLDDDAPAVALIHALRRLGAVHVPLNRRLAPPELRAQLELVAPVMLVTDEGWSELARAAAPPGMAVRRVEGLTSDATARAGAPLRGEVDLASVATVAFTSGTTGAPKGALLTHDNHRASAHAWAGLLRPGPGHRWLACLPLFHVAGLALVMRTTRWGAPLELLPAFDAAAVSDAIERGVTHLSLVPVQLSALLDVRGSASPPATLRAILLGGGPIPAALVEGARAAGYPVLTTYGQTETSSGVASGGGDPLTWSEPLLARALPGVRMRVEPDAPDGSGEILVRGGMVFAGYAGDRAASAKRLADGWLRTGDIGTLDADGLLRVLDRRDDRIISGGENIAPAEVEAVLTAHPDVAEAAVIGRPDDRWGAVPVAFIVPMSGATPAGADLGRHCRERVAGYKVPVSFKCVDELPRNTFGKVLRHRLQEQLSRQDDDKVWISIE
jgi:O-succinylbenzoic acid--CoA ligase